MGHNLPKILVDALDCGASMTADQLRRTHVNSVVDLTGRETRGHTFINCVVHLHSWMGSTVCDCYFESCDLVGDAWVLGIMEGGFENG